MFILLIPLLIVVAIVVAARRHSDAGDGGLGSVTPEGLAARWRSAALISADQERAILEYERAHAPIPAPPTSHAPVVAEVLGYVGAILAAIGIAIVVARVDLSLQTGALLALVLGAVLIAAGFAVPEAAGGPWWRFHQVLWALGLAGITIAAGIQVGGVGEHSGAAVALACGAVGTIVGGLLYARHDRPAQLLLWFAGLVAATVGGSLLITDGGVLTAGLLLALGAAWFTTAWRGLLPPRSTALALGVLLLAAAAAPAGGTWDPFIGFGIASVITAAFVLVGYRTRENAVLLPALAATTLVFTFSLSMAEDPWQFWLAAAVLLGIGVGAIREAWDRHDAESVSVQLMGALALLIPGGMVWAHIPEDSAGGFVALLAGIAIAAGITALGALRARPWLAGIGLVGILVYVPWTVAQFFEGKAVPVTLVLVGLIGIGAAVRSLRHRATPPPAPPLLGP
jgi:hypothetical protein